MANPTLPDVSNAEAVALETVGTDTQFGTGLNYIPEDQAVDGSPQELHTVYTQFVHNLARLLPTEGKVIHAATGGVNVGVYSLKYQIGGVDYAYAGQNSVALTDDATNYLYLDGSATVQMSTSAFPVNVWMLAIVVAAGGEITSLADVRQRNVQVGVVNDWSANVATQDVDLAGYLMGDVGGVRVTAPTELTIAAGVITPTQYWHTVDTESDAASDLLDTLTATAGTIGRKVFLRAEDVSRVVTVNGGTGNISMQYAGPYVLDAVEKWIELMQISATSWVETGRYSPWPEVAEGDLNMTLNSVHSIGALELEQIEKTIAAGSFSLQVTPGSTTYTMGFIRVDTESDAATDDLDTVTDAMGNQLLFLVPEHDARTVVVKHAVGANKFLLANERDFPMTSTEHVLVCYHDGTQWVEISRSPMDLADLVDTSQAIPYTLTFFVPGALTAKVYEQEIFCPAGFTLINATSRVATAPSGGDCVTDVHVDAASIFSNDSERPVITDGNVEGTSATKDHAVATGSTLRIAVLGTSGSPNGAEDLTVTLNGQIAAVTPP